MFDLIGSAGFEVMIVAMCVAIGTNLFNKLIIKRDRLEEIKKQTKELQKRIAEARKSKDPNAMKKAEQDNKEMMKLIKEQMMMSFKPLMFTFIPIIIIFMLMGMWYGDKGIVVTGVPIFNQFAWLGWYIMVSILTVIPVEIIYKIYRIKKKAKKKD